MKDVSLFTSVSYNIGIIISKFSYSERLRKYFAYFSILLFIPLVIFISSSVNNYVTNTLSISLAQPEIEALEDTVSFKNILVKKGDNLKSILIEQDIPKPDIDKIIKLVNDGKLSSSLQIGQKIAFEYETKIIESKEDDIISEVFFLNKIVIAIDKLKNIEIIREDSNFIVKEVLVPVNKEIIKVSVVINSSLMMALQTLGLSNNSIIELINAYSYQVDFQRQIKNGDTATVIAEKYITEDGKFSHHGKVLYVSLNLSGKEYNVYRYSHDNNPDNQIFFSEDGKSAKRSLLKTPLKLIRISSSYGARKHPILGYTKMHKGVDFAAPTGTPIYSAGNGVITTIGYKSGYGNFIQIKHSGTLSTAYAHASKFAKNLKVGSIVKQGQVIAFVGSTGRATGPHLHYEVKINGKHINPMSVKTTPGIELQGINLTKFNQFKQRIKTLSIQSISELTEYNKLDGSLS